MNKPIKFIVIIIVAIIVVLSGIYVAEIYGYHPKIKEGVELTINSNVTGLHFNKIVSLDPSVTATLYAIGAIKDVTGIYAYPGLWPGSNITGNITSISAYPTMNIQEILNLSPQAVISFSNYKQSQITELLNAGIDYIFLSSGADTTFHTIKKQDTFLGEITGNSKNATLLNNWINTSLQEFNNVNVSNKTAMYAMCVYNGKTYTAGNNTFVSSMMKYSHLINIANGAGFYQISNENITNSNISTLILGSSFNVTYLNSTPYKETPAVQQHKYYVAFSYNIFSEPNFRNIYAIQWMISNVFNKNVTIPAFPFHLKDSPEPQAVIGIENSSQ